MFGKKKDKKDAKDKTKQGKKMNPGDMGTAVFEIYRDSMAKLAGMFESKPDPATVKDEIAAYKEDLIQKLIVYGKARQEMSDGDRAKFNQKLTDGMWNVNRDHFQVISDAVNHYNSVDGDFAALLSSFNIITQYAQLELLQKQEPKEVERLGLTL